MLLELHQQRGNNSVVVVTHSSELASRFPTRYELVDQQLKESAEDRVGTER